MLIVPSAQRFNMSQVVNHPWLRLPPNEMDVTSESDPLMEYRSFEEDEGVAVESELGQQILSHMATLGLDTEVAVRVRHFREELFLMCWKPLILLLLPNK